MTTPSLPSFEDVISQLMEGIDPNWFDENPYVPSPPQPLSHPNPNDVQDDIEDIEEWEDEPSLLAPAPLPSSSRSVITPLLLQQTRAPLPQLPPSHHLPQRASQMPHPPSRHPIHHPGLSSSSSSSSSSSPQLPLPLALPKLEEEEQNDSRNPSNKDGIGGKFESKKNKPPPSEAIPNFVQQYYQTSTFHHLSSWRLHFQKVASDKALPTHRLFASSSSSSSSASSSLDAFNSSSLRAVPTLSATHRKTIQQEASASSISSCSSSRARLPSGLLGSTGKRRKNAITSSPRSCDKSSSSSSSSSTSTPSPPSSPSTFDSPPRSPTEEDLSQDLELDKEGFSTQELRKGFLVELPSHLSSIVQHEDLEEEGGERRGGGSARSHSVGVGGGGKGKDRIILHIDMDCFYASVAIRDNPSLAGKPVIVCPSKNFNGTSEVASASYEARKFGVKPRMFIRDAKKLCPEAIVVACQYAKYEQVSKTVYEIFFKHSNKVQPVSADEALLDITDFDLNGDGGEKVAKLIRDEIHQKTGCTASAGISHNVLLARLATKKAKPNGQYRIKKEEVDNFLEPLPVTELPNVGFSIADRLGAAGIKTVGDLRQKPQTWLQKQLGQKNGAKLYSLARGIDERTVQTYHQRKSIGTQISWGVRFKESEQVKKFLEDVGQEVSRRMRELNLKGRRVSLRIKKRKSNPNDVSIPKPTTKSLFVSKTLTSFKFMNPGAVDMVTKSGTLSQFTCDGSVIAREAYRLFKQMNVLPEDVRGVALQMEQLNNNIDAFKDIQNKSTSLDKFLAPRGTTTTILPTVPTKQLEAPITRPQTESPVSRCQNKGKESLDLSSDDDDDRYESGRGGGSDSEDLSDGDDALLDATIDALQQQVIPSPYSSTQSSSASSKAPLSTRTTGARLQIGLGAPLVEEEEKNVNNKRGRRRSGEVSLSQQKKLKQATLCFFSQQK